MSVSDHRFVATDLSLYTKRSADDVDFMEMMEYTTKINMNGGEVYDGFNIFACREEYKKKVGNVSPKIIVAVGFHHSTDSGDVSYVQKKVFRGDMGRLNAVAVDALQTQFPESTVCIITSSDYAHFARNHNFGNVHVMGAITKVEGFELTNVKYGERDPEERNLDGESTVILANCAFANVARHVQDEKVNVFTLIASAAEEGNVLFVAGNRFQAAYEIMRYIKDNPSITPFQSVEYKSEPRWFRSWKSAPAPGDDDFECGAMSSYAAWSSAWEKRTYWQHLEMYEQFGKDVAEAARDWTEASYSKPLKDFTYVYSEDTYVTSEASYVTSASSNATSESSSEDDWGTPAS